MINPTNTNGRKGAIVLLWLFSIAYLSLGGWLAYLDKVSAATLCVAAAMLLLLIANLDKLEHFKGLGIEAKMRQLDQRISEADDWLKHMRNLSRAMGQLTFEILSKTGRWSGPPSRATSLEIAKTLRGHMEAIGIDPAEIDSAMAPWHKMNLFDMSVPVYSAIREVLTEHQRQWDQELKQYPVPVAAGDPKHQNIIDMRRCYGEQIEKLRKQWESEIFHFAIHSAEIIQALEGVSDDAKQALAEATEADRKAAAHYARHNRFLSESKWLEDQPKYD